MPTDAKGLIHHVELHVSNFHKSVEFWGWLLGQLGYTEYQKWERGPWDRGRSWRLGHAYVVVVQADEKNLQPPFNRKRIGLHHIAFHVGSRPELDELRTKLKIKMVTFLYREWPPPANKPYALYFLDPDGIEIELVAA